jgi:hypothetical protein
LLHFLSVHQKDKDFRYNQAYVLQSVATTDRKDSEPGGVFERLIVNDDS